MTDPPHTDLLLINFAHPLTPEARTRIAELTGAAAVEVRDVPAHFDQQQPFIPQVVALADACSLSSAQWQTAAIVVNPPALNFIAVALLAELHGRMGYFPTVLQLRPVAGSLPPRFEVAGLLPLQELRDAARGRRAGATLTG